MIIDNDKSIMLHSTKTSNIHVAGKERWMNAARRASRRLVWGPRLMRAGMVMLLAGMLAAVVMPQPWWQDLGDWAILYTFIIIGCLFGGMALYAFGRNFYSPFF